MLKRSVLVAAFFIGWISTCRAEPTGEQFFKAYDAANPDQQYVMRLIAQGVSQGIAYADALKPGPPLYCPPKNLALASEQLLVMMRDALAARPKVGTFPVGILVIDALQFTFPCSGR